MDPARDEFGRVSLPPVMVGRPMSAKELFRLRCFQNGIRDADDVARLWAEEQAKAPKKPKKKRRR